MTEKRNAPTLPDRQTISAPFTVTELRAVTAGDTTPSTVAVEGVASVYDYQYDVYGGPARGGWTEQVAKGAFTQTLADKPDVVFLVNHEGLPIARTKSGTLELKAGKTGLEVRSQLDTRDTEVANLLVKMERGDINEMSFAFRVTKQSWQATDAYPDDEMALRTIEEVNLHRGDVSAVTYGASDATSIDIKRSLRLVGDDELEELQALIVARLARNAAPDGTSELPVAGGIPVHMLQLLRLQRNRL